MMNFLFFLLSVLAFGIANAQYPGKPIRIVLPFPPGGPTGVVGRLLALSVSASLAAGNVRELIDVAKRNAGKLAFGIGSVGSAGLPREITVRLSGETNKALASDLRERLLAQGYELAPGTPEDFTRFQRDDMARSSKVIAEANIRAG